MDILSKYFAVILFLLTISFCLLCRSDSALLHQRPQKFHYEPHIPNSISPSCTAIIVSSSLINLEDNSFSRPQMVLRKLDHFVKKKRKLHLKDYCNILIFDDIYAQSKFSVQKFLRESALLIKLVLVYIPGIGSETNLTQVKLFRQFSQSKATLILVSKETGKSSIYKYLLDCKNSLKCKLKGRRLRVGYTDSPPSLTVLLSWDVRKKIGSPVPTITVNDTLVPKLIFAGLEADLLDLLTNEYGMSFTLIAPNDFEFGKADKHGHYNGKLGLLQRREVDIIIGGIVANGERSRIGKYSQQIFTNKFILTTLAPVSSPAWNSAIKPFPLLGWTILGLSILVVAPVSWYITKTHVRLTTGMDSYKRSVWVYYAHATATLLVEPWPKPPGGPASIILASWFLGCLILQSIYSSNFVAHLSIPEAESPIRKLEEAWAQKKRIIVTPNGTFELFLKSSLDPKLNELYRNSLEVTQNSDEIFELIDQGFVSTMNSNLMMYKLSRLPKHSREKYHASKTSVLGVFVAWLFSHDHQPLERHLNCVILRAAAAGLFTKWQEEMQSRLSTKSSIDQSAYKATLRLALDQQSQALSISHLRGVFVFYILGNLLGIFVYILEHLKQAHSSVKKIKRS